MLIRLLLIIGIALSIVLFTMLVFYIREIVKWRRLLMEQLNALGRETACQSGPRALALAYIENKCRNILKGRVPVADLLNGLPGDVQRIATLFHPEALRPELRATPAHILACVDRSMGRLALIRSRPGFELLAPVTMNELIRLNDLYHSAVAPTPGSGGRPPLLSMIDLVKNVRLLVLARYLTVDLYCIAGHLAVSVYGYESSYLMNEKKIDLEQALRELSRIKITTENTLSPELMRIRSNLVGFSTVVIKNPSLAAWNQAVIRAAGLIAKGYFPESSRPLFEGRIGLLLSRSQVFLGNLGKGEGFWVAGKLSNIRLETLFQAQSMFVTLIPDQVRRIVMSTQKTYGWVKWPLNLYMMASKGVFWKIAVDLGWFAGRKAMLVLIFGKSFDKAVHELDLLYRLSSGKTVSRHLMTRDVTARGPVS